jgi:hypothetical protein
MRGQIVDVPGPDNLTVDEPIEITEAFSRRSGRVSHAPRAAMRFLSVALRLINPMRAGQIGAALVMDTRDMAVDGLAVRTAYPSIPMTRAREMAMRLYGEVPAAANIASILPE